MRAIAAGLLGMALSTSSAFASGLCTTTGFADVTGDGKADAISVSRSFWSERTFVWRSSGTAFQSRETWTSTRRRAAFGTAATYSFADVDGDKKADAIYITATGISVRISDGTQFGNPASWSTEPIASDQRVFVADATGDGKADIILVSWTRPLRVRVSDGTQFLPETDWGQLRPPDQPSGVYILAGDITGDKRADILAYGLYKDNPPSSGFHSEQMLRRVQTVGGGLTGPVAIPGPAYPPSGMPVPQGKFQGWGYDPGGKIVAGHDAFGPEEAWASGVQQFAIVALADVSGDGLSDFFITGGTDDFVPGQPFKARVGPATQQGFALSLTAPWGLLAFQDPSRLRLGLADVSGDGAADAIVVNDNEVLVYRSNFVPGTPGTAFLPQEIWFSGAMSGNVMICD